MMSFSTGRCGTCQCQRLPVDAYIVVKQRDEAYQKSATAKEFVVKNDAVLYAFESIELEFQIR